MANPCWTVPITIAFQLIFYSPLKLLNVFTAFFFIPLKFHRKYHRYDRYMEPAQPPWLPVYIKIVYAINSNCKNMLLGTSAILSPIVASRLSNYRLTYHKFVLLIIWKYWNGSIKLIEQMLDRFKKKLNCSIFRSNAPIWLDEKSQKIGSEAKSNRNSERTE